jgi:hypothetical protein
MSKPRTRRRFHTEATNFGSEAGRTRQQARHNPSRVGRRGIRAAWRGRSSARTTGISAGLRRPWGRAAAKDQTELGSAVELRASSGMESSQSSKSTTTRVLLQDGPSPAVTGTGAWPHSRGEHTRRPALDLGAGTRASGLEDHNRRRKDMDTVRRACMGDVHGFEAATAKAGAQGEQHRYPDEREVEGRAGGGRWRESARHRRPHQGTAMANREAHVRGNSAAGRARQPWRAGAGAGRAGGWQREREAREGAMAGARRIQRNGGEQGKHPGIRTLSASHRSRELGELDHGVEGGHGWGARAGSRAPRNARRKQDAMEKLQQGKNAGDGQEAERQ